MPAVAGTSALRRGKAGRAGDDVRSVGAVAQAVEAALAAGQARDDEPRVVVDDDRH